MPEAADPRPDPSRSPRWVVVRTAPDQMTAEIWRGLLEDEGIPATLAPGDAVAFLGVSPRPCRLMVPDGVLEAAERALEGELWVAEGTDEAPHA